MRIGGSREGAFGYGDKPSRGTTPPAEPKSRALTVVSAPARTEVPQLSRGNAAFIAHLIATKEQAPQTREKRRAEPAEVLAAYRAAARLA